jgi:hypothetical protein
MDSQQAVVPQAMPPDNVLESEQNAEPMDWQHPDVTIASKIAVCPNKDKPNNPFRNTVLYLLIELHRWATFYGSDLEPKLKLAQSGFFLNITKDAVQCNFCGVKIPGESIKEFGDFNVDLLHNSSCPMMSNPNQSDNIPTVEKDYKFEVIRLFSFSTAGWNAPVPIIDVAKSGFFWTGIEDNCQCIYCNLQVRGWKLGDTPDAVHYKYSSNCRFLNDKPVGNVKIGEELQYWQPITAEGIPSSSQNINPFPQSERKSE